MRPTIDEHLIGIERVLELEVGPHLEGYPAEALRRTLSDIRRLRRSWRHVESFLTWDNDAVRALLGRYGAAAGTGPLDVGDASLSGPHRPETYDELCDSNTELRRALASVAVEIERGRDTTLRRDLLSYLTERGLRLERLGDWAGSLTNPLDGADEADEIALPS